ncbi:MAG: DUF2993 domain-containing protein [Candidatus Wallbacteria bacterium]|nr:DUF2993 domain-containing protein [Candidatus Wallbacteria bacterium]
MRRAITSFAIILFVLLGGRPLAADGGTTSTPRKDAAVHQKPPAELLEHAIRSFFEPPNSCKVEIRSGSASDTLQGRFSSLRLRVDKTIVKGMPIEAATIDLKQFAIDLPLLRNSGKIRVFSADRLTYRITVTEVGLNWLISGKKKLAKDHPPKLELGDGEVILDGHLRAGLFNSPFRLKGSLAARREREVHFIPDYVSVGWLPLPGFLMDMVAGRINPIATLEKLLELQRCNVKIREVVVSPGMMVVTG